MKVTLQYWLNKDTDVTLVGITSREARATLDKVKWVRYEMTNDAGYIYERDYSLALYTVALP